MFRIRLSTLILALAVSLFSTLSSPAQCGTYFRSDYRAVDKIRREMNSGNYLLADWTGDGRSDFWNFRFNQTTQTADVIVFPSQLTGYWNWDAPITYSTALGSAASTAGNTSFAFRLADFDGDGKMDMYVGEDSLGARIHRNMGNSTLVAQAQIPPASLRHIGYYNITGDGRLEWLYISTESGITALRYSILNADFSFGPSTLMVADSPDIGLTSSFFAVADINGDTKLDFVLRNFGSAGSPVRVLTNTGDGTFSVGTAQTSIPSGGAFTRDFNNDGRGDLWGREGSNVYIAYGQSDGTFATSFYPATSTHFPEPAELNGDGRLDLILIGEFDYEVLINNPAGGFTSRTYPKSLVYRTITSNLSPYVLEDFSGDGKADLYLSFHDVYNTFSEEVVVIKANVCVAKGETRAMNFDSSILPDIVTWNSANGEWRTGNGNWNATTFVPIQSFFWGFGSHGDVPAPGDFDGDGRTDYSVYRNSTGNWYVYLSSTSGWLVFQFGIPGDIPIPNDYNGAGKSDFAVFRPSDGNWYIWYTETQSYSITHWGSKGDRPAPADFDGDGKVDIGLFRPSDGNWYYIRSSDGGFGIFHWGTTGDIPLSADYDGDGKADLAVYRAGIWHILRTSNGQYAPTFYGTTGDVPIPYLERGEVFVPTIYRPSNGRWFNSRYPTGYALQLNGPPVYFGLPNN